MSATQTKGKKFNITLAIFIGLVLGIIVGFVMPEKSGVLAPILDLVSSVYMSALRMMIYPLVFASLIVGIKGIGSVSATGKIGLRVFFIIAVQLFSPAFWVCFFQRHWVSEKALQSRWRNQTSRLHSSQACWIPSRI